MKRNLIEEMVAVIKYFGLIYAVGFITLWLAHYINYGVAFLFIGFAIVGLFLKRS